MPGLPQRLHYRDVNKHWRTLWVVFSCQLQSVLQFKATMCWIETDASFKWFGHFVWRNMRNTFWCLYVLFSVSGGVEWGVTLMRVKPSFILLWLWLYSDCTFMTEWIRLEAVACLQWTHTCLCTCVTSQSLCLCDSLASGVFMFWQLTFAGTSTWPATASCLLN